MVLSTNTETADGDDDDDGCCCDHQRPSVALSADCPAPSVPSLCNWLLWQRGRMSSSPAQVNSAIGGRRRPKVAAIESRFGAVQSTTVVVDAEADLESAAAVRVGVQLAECGGTCPHTHRSGHHATIVVCRRCTFRRVSFLILTRIPLLLPSTHSALRVNGYISLDSRRHC